MLVNIPMTRIPEQEVPLPNTPQTPGVSQDQGTPQSPFVPSAKIWHSQKDL